MHCQIQAECIHIQIWHKKNANVKYDMRHTYTLLRNTCAFSIANFEINWQPSKWKKRRSFKEKLKHSNQLLTIRYVAFIIVSIRLVGRGDLLVLGKFWKFSVKHNHHTPVTARLTWQLSDEVQIWGVFSLRTYLVQARYTWTVISIHMLFLLKTTRPFDSLLVIHSEPLQIWRVS